MIRRTGLPKRTAPLKRGKPPKRTALKAKINRNPHLVKARAVAHERSENLCEAKWSCCVGFGAHAHHIKRRSQGGADTADNLLIVCVPCHQAIHANPEVAYGIGHLKSGSDA